METNLVFDSLGQSSLVNTRFIVFFTAQSPNFPVAERDGIAVNAGAGVAGRDGEPGLQVAGVEDGELLHEGDDHDAAVHGDVGDLRVEFDVMDLAKVAIER